MQISSFTGTRLERVESSPSFPVILFPFPFALLCFYIKSSSLFTTIQEKLLYSALQMYWNSKDKIALLAVESRHLQIWLKDEYETKLQNVIFYY